MNKPKVLLIHNVLAPYRIPIFKDLAEKFDLTIGICTEDPEREWGNEPPKTLNVIFFNFYTAFTFIFNIGVVAHMLREDYDACIISETTQMSPTVLATVAIARIRGVKVICWTEEIENQTPAPSNRATHLKVLIKVRDYYAVRYRKLVYRWADSVVALSPYAADNVRRIAGNIDVESTIQSYPRELFFQPAAPSELFSNTDADRIKDDFVILYLGYIRNGKGIDLLISALDQIDQQNLTLIVAGSGDRKEQLIESAGDDIWFTGYVEGEKKATLLAYADLLVLPSYYDAWGLVVNEALYYNTPVIATTSCGSAEIVHGRGYIIRPGSVSALRNVIEEALNLGTTDSLIRKPVSEHLFSSETISEPLSKTTLNEIYQ